MSLINLYTSVYSDIFGILNGGIISMMGFIVTFSDSYIISFTLTLTPFHTTRETFDMHWSSVYDGY